MSENVPSRIEPSAQSLEPSYAPEPALDSWPREPQDEGLGFSPQRLLSALLRFKWVILLSMVLGSGAAYYAYGSTAPIYRAEGSLWVNSNRNSQDLPITQEEILGGNAWVDVLLSARVLQPVVVQERMYISTSADDRPLFEDFQLAERFVTGAFILTVAPGGRWTLATDDDQQPIETGSVGEPIGFDLGFRWTPPSVELYPREVAFSVVAPRDAVNRLANDLQTGTDRAGIFITIRLEGRDPDRIARILSAIMTRHIELAADLKRAQHEQLTELLKVQLDTVTADLATAERALENYRVNTVTLPTDQSAPIAGGLQQTQASVFSDFFTRRVDLENLRIDQARIQEVLDGLPAEGLAVEAFELIPSVSTSSELSRALSDLVTERANVRVLRNSYTDEHQLVKEALQAISVLEQQSIPRQARTLLAQLEIREVELDLLMEDRANELRQIPTRVLQESKLTRDRDIQNSFYIDLEGRYQRAQLAAASSIPDVSILDEPQAPGVPSSDGRMRLATLAFLGFLGVGLVGVVLLDRFDPRIRYPLEIQDDMGIEILGAIPRIKLRGKTNTDRVTEAFREIRMRVDYAYGNAKPLIVAITSPDTGEGKTLIAANLAIAFAQLKRRTLLIDGDTRRGDLHELMERERKPGLTDVLQGQANGAAVKPTEHENLYFMGSGSRLAHAPELIGGPRMQEMMALAKQRFDVIIVDCPPMAAGGDAFILGAHAGNVLIVMRSGSTHKELARAKMEAFYRLPVRILGAILNDIESGSSYGAYRYHSYYVPGYRALSEIEEPEEAGAL